MFPAIDLFVHGWDLAEAAGNQVEIPDDVIEASDTYLDPIPEDMMRAAPRARSGPRPRKPSMRRPPGPSWPGR